MSTDIASLRSWIDSRQTEMVQALQELLRIPSKLEEPAGPSAPYGRPIREALDYTLGLSERLGFRVHDVDGHAGHAEFGEGKEMVAAMGHLDVVPEGGGWTYPPFGAEVHNGAIYARGASDDKGPTLAALFGAAAILHARLPLRRRIRIIFGCNEESGMSCLKHYWGPAGMERPVAAFTPDAAFPLIYAEKGIVDLRLQRTLPPAASPLTLTSLGGGLRSNMVPEEAAACLGGSTDALKEAAEVLTRYWDRNVWHEVTASGLVVTARGRSAHGSTPHEGDNAIVRLCRALRALRLPEHDAWLEWLIKSGEGGGSGLGIEGRDDVVGPLTANLGLLDLREGTLTAVYNIRYPVKWNQEEVIARAARCAGEEGWSVAALGGHAPLYAPLDQEPARTLLEVYRLETGDHQTQPGTMGGGTYARQTPNAVAYGMALPNVADGPAHEPDERLHIQSYLLGARIYAHALYALAR